MKEKEPKANALISAFRKTDELARLAKKIESLRFKIYASGGTAKFLTQNGIKAINIQRLTGFPPILDHRVVTLHPKIHAGILAKESEKHERQLKRLKIPKFDLIIVDLYPVWDGIKSGNLEKALELVDIGGPTMLRAAAKNFNNGRIVVCDLKDSERVVSELEAEGQLSFETRKRLAAEVFSLMKKYDGAVANFLGMDRRKKLRYGENPHQKGWLTSEDSSRDSLAIQKFEQIQGKELSFNNYLDIDASISALAEVGGGRPACVIIKHTNPAGLSVKDSVNKAYESAWYEGDPLAAFGGVIGVNRLVDARLAGKMLTGKDGEKKFFEVLIAPKVDNNALGILSTRRDLRILVNPTLKNPKPSAEKDFKKVRGGILYQDLDNKKITEKDLKIVTKKKPTKEQVQDLLFAWKAVKICKSNAICLVKNQTLIASGVGQQDRKEACKIAAVKSVDPDRGKSKSTPVGSVAASDAFFPFPDGPEILIKAGAKVIIQPGGSIRDQETIDLCNRHKVVMIFTGVRSFKH